MEALAWLAIPVVATLVAMVWVVVANRERPPADMRDTMEQHQRFTEALREAEQRRPPDPGSAGSTRT